MIKLSKILLICSLFTFGLNASSIDDKVLSFEKNRFSKNKRIEVQNISINMKKELSLKGWTGYILDIEALMGGKSVKAKDIVFTDSNVITGELFDINTNSSFKDIMTPTLSTKYYDKSKLIAGTHGAKDKIVVFSDPVCPFCIDFVPDIIEYVNKRADKIALYYYHFPLVRIHPAALTLSKLMILAKEKGIEDIEYKVYKTDWDKYFTSKQKGERKILDAFNKEFKTTFTLAQIIEEKLNKEIMHDMNMGEDVLVQGTPTIFINGEQDKTKLKYETLGL